MSWKIKTGTAVTPNWAHLTEVPTSYQAAPLTLSFDYRGADRFTWEARTGQHWDVPQHQKVIFEYPIGTIRFRGRFKVPRGVGRPGAQGWAFDCVGQRGLARNVTVTDGSTGYPERIYNAPATDADYHRSIFAVDGSPMTIGEILKDLFDTFWAELEAEDAVVHGAPMYSTSELNTLSHVPEKVVLRETNFEAAVMQVLAMQGMAFGIWVDMSIGTWHFVDRRSGALPTKTLTLGTDDIKDEQISTSTDECFTAVKLFGRLPAGGYAVKEKVGFGTDQSGQTLAGLGKAWDESEEVNWTLEKAVGEKDHGKIATIGEESAPDTWLYITCTGKDWTVDFWNGAGGSPAMGEAGTISFPGWNHGKSYDIVSNTADKIVFDAGADYAAVLAQVAAGAPFSLSLRTIFSDMFRRFYLTDPAKRQIIQSGDYGAEDCCPRFAKTGYWNDGSFAYRIPVPIRFEPTTEEWGGAPIDVAIVAKHPLYKRAVAGGELFDDLALEYCYRNDTAGVALEARYPVSGFAGTAYTKHGLEREKALIVPEFKYPDLQADFVNLAALLLKPYQDVRVWGDVTLAGLDTAYFDPRVRIYIAHASETIDWATELNASPAGVTFDFTLHTTRVEISNDWRDGFNYSDLLHRRIGEKLAEREIEEGRKRDEYTICNQSEVSSHEGPQDGQDKWTTVEGDTGEVNADEKEDTLKVRGTTKGADSYYGDAGAEVKVQALEEGVPPKDTVKISVRNRGFKTINVDNPIGGHADADENEDTLALKGADGLTVNRISSKEIEIKPPPQVSHKYWKKVQGDAGVAEADTAGDTLSIVGASGSGISTSVSENPEVVTINFTGGGAGLPAFGVIAVGTSDAEADVQHDTVAFVQNAASRLLITIPAAKQVKWELLGESVVLSNPLITQWKRLVVAGNAGLTRCDGTTYDPTGAWADPQKTASGCANRTHPHMYGANAATYQCRSYPDYKGIGIPTSDWGTAYSLHGIILRAGGASDYSNPPPMTQHVYPFICRGTTYPSATVGTCGNAPNNPKDLLIVTPDDANVDTATETTLAELIPAWLRGYANALMFMNQAHMCLDDRLYILEKNLMGSDVEKGDCGKDGFVSGRPVLQQICACVRGITTYFGQYCNSLDVACNDYCHNCTGGHTCTRPVGAPDPYSLHECTLSTQCCASCTVGWAEECWVVI